MTIPSGAASSSPRKSLVWRYLSLGSRRPIATSGPLLVMTGVIERSTWCETPLECLIRASRTVTSILFVSTAATATRWKSCMASRPKFSTVCPVIASAGMPTISLAPAFANRTTPPGSTITSASSDLSTWSVSAPYSHSGVYCSCSMQVHLDARPEAVGGGPGSPLTSSAHYDERGAEAGIRGASPDWTSRRLDQSVCSPDRPHDSGHRLSQTEVLGREHRG